MFSYCNNSTVLYIDDTGYIPQMRVEPPDFTYIYDQNAQPHGTFLIGNVNVSYGGCAVVASYNALISLNNPKSFEDVLNYYNSKPSKLMANGRLGIRPEAVQSYFESFGYTVYLTSDHDFIDALSKTADACILFYMYTQTKKIPLIGIECTLPGAHYIEYVKTGTGYFARNTSDQFGYSSFRSPVEYGERGSRFCVTGVFIYD